MTDFSISFRVTSLLLWQSYYCEFPWWTECPRSNPEKHTIKPCTYVWTNSLHLNLYREIKSHIYCLLNQPYSWIDMTDMHINIAGNIWTAIVIKFTCIFGSLFHHIINTLILNSISSWAEDFQMTSLQSTIDMVPAWHLSTLTEPLSGQMVWWWFELSTFLKNC